MVKKIKEEILDPTCGGRHIWSKENKDREDVLYADIRHEEEGYDEHRPNFSVEPDEIQDYTDLEYEDNSFNLIVWDPPHIVREDGQKQMTGRINKKYGALRAETWQSDIKKGFKEHWRVLKPGGTLVFKFHNGDIPFQDVLELCHKEPMFGTMTKQKSGYETRWFVFYKPEK